MNIIEKLNKIQTSLIAPKSSYNNFGKYAYRTCESILESVKPLLEEVGVVVTLSDKPVVVGDRVYIEATARLIDTEKPEDTVSATAYARESDMKKGMDPAQVTGASSSYARKYALCGLFAIDGADDPDATNTHGKTTSGQTEHASKQELNSLAELAKGKGFTLEQLEKASRDAYQCSFNELSKVEVGMLRQRISNAPARMS